MRLTGYGANGSLVRRIEALQHQGLVKAAHEFEGFAIARAHHDARFVAADLVALVSRLAPPSHWHKGH